MDLLTSGFGFLHQLSEFAHRCRLLHAHLRSHVSHAVHRTIPHNVFNVDVVAQEILLIGIHINHAHKSFALLSEIVEKRRVLAEWRIGIVGIVAWSIIIAKKDNKTALHQLLKLVAATLIYI